jgi:RNA polymerase sigma factor (sigma-70 family)
MRVANTVADLDAGSSNMSVLLCRAATGDVQAWSSLVSQYGRLIWSITARFKLMEDDGADVVQTTWLRLIEHIDRIQQPDRIGYWLAATARNECLRYVAARRRLVLVRENTAFDGVDYQGPQVDEALLAAERVQVVREAIAHLPAQSQRLLELLMADPPIPYAEISDQLGVPLGSIGPTRRRCLAKLRVLLEAS